MDEYLAKRINENDDVNAIFNILENSDDSFLQRSIDFSLFDSVRGPNAFKANNIQTYGDILNIGKESFYNIPWLGRKTIKDTLRVIELVKSGVGSIDIKTESEIYLTENYRIKLIERLSRFGISIQEGNNLETVEFQKLLDKLNECLLNFLEENTTNRRCIIYKDRVIYNLTLDQIGTKFGITRERVRQIIVKVDRIISQNFMNNDIVTGSKYVNDYYKLIYEIDDMYLSSVIEQLLFQESIHSGLIKKIANEANFNISRLKTVAPPIDEKKMDVLTKKKEYNIGCYSKMSSKQKEFVRLFTRWIEANHPKVHLHFLYGIPQYIIGTNKKPVFWFVLDKNSNLLFKYYYPKDNNKAISLITNVDCPNDIHIIVDDILSNI